MAFRSFESEDELLYMVRRVLHRFQDWIGRFEYARLLFTRSSTVIVVKSPSHTYALLIRQLRDDGWQPDGIPMAGSYANRTNA